MRRGSGEFEIEMCKSGLDLKRVPMLNFGFMLLLEHVLKLSTDLRDSLVINSDSDIAASGLSRSILHSLS